MVSSHSLLLLQQGGHQLFSWHSSLLLPPWQKMGWPGTRNQGTRHLQKTCLLLSPGEKTIPCPWSLKMQCCGQNRLGWESRMGALRQHAEGKGSCGELAGLWKTHQHLATNIPWRGGLQLAHSQLGHSYSCRHQPAPLAPRESAERAAEQTAPSASSVQSTSCSQKLKSMSNTDLHRSAVSCWSFSAPFWLLCS